MPCYFSNDFRRRWVFGFWRWGKKKLYSVGILPPKVKCKWKAAVVLLLFCLFLGQDSDFEDLLTSSSISTLLDAQGFSDLEKSLSPTPVMESPSRDPFNTSVPEEVFTESQFFLHIEEIVSSKVKMLLTTWKTWDLFSVWLLTEFWQFLCLIGLHLKCVFFPLSL